MTERADYLDLALSLLDPNVGELSVTLPSGKTVKINVAIRTWNDLAPTSISARTRETLGIMDQQQVPLFIVTTGHNVRVYSDPLNASISTSIADTFQYATEINGGVLPKYLKDQL